MEYPRWCNIFIWCFSFGGWIIQGPVGHLSLSLCLSLSHRSSQQESACTDEWIRKLWYIYTREYYSAIKKECIWISSNEVDETGAHYTEWSKSERKTIQYINAYIWNLERWQQWSYMQGRKETHVNNRLIDSVGEGQGGMIWENSTETCILPYVK